ncbi:hypothetical protein [Actinomadura roseirufa]|uniref:hypothetical protein n=1 Tax=Actinomadura roseirufa TaxID=2094049 RepID=UPI0013F16CA5|nr:hypothetical protein [Actinomadura roseirufa]
MGDDEAAATVIGRLAVGSQRTGRGTGQRVGAAKPMLGRIVAAVAPLSQGGSGGFLVKGTAPTECTGRSRLVGRRCGGA